jgi:hypothetical protein
MIRIPDLDFFTHPGSGGQKGTGSGSATLGVCLHRMMRKYLLLAVEEGMPGPGPDLDFLPIPDPGVKKAPDPEFGSATLGVCLRTCSQLLRQTCLLSGLFEGCFQDTSPLRQTTAHEVI